MSRRWLGPLIAERELEKRDRSGRRAGIRIGRPRRAREGDYECRYELYGFGRVRRMRVFGVDEVQALQLVFVALRAELHQLGADALWLEDPAYTGFPLTVPSYLPDKYASRVETALVKANAAFIEEAKAKIVKKQRADSRSPTHSGSSARRRRRGSRS